MVNEVIGLALTCKIAGHVAFANTVTCVESGQSGDSPLILDAAGSQETGLRESQHRFHGNDISVGFFATVGLSDRKEISRLHG